MTDERNLALLRYLGFAPMSRKRFAELFAAGPPMEKADYARLERFELVRLPLR